MMRGLYAITPNLKDTAEFLGKVEQALQGGAAILQYRNKQADAALRLEQARALRALTKQYGACLIINDDVQLAVQVGADGVHLGGEDGDLIEARARLSQGMLLGASCYNDLALAHAAVAAGVDYVAFGAVFASGTKPEARRASLELIKQARAEITLPIVAIGGITPHNAAQVVAAGADCVAVIGALFESGNIRQTAERFAELF
ncbi:thiamine-phosphate diphosphorylase [Formivibrio citricus]|uniref:Thiamine-phosphate synthase n=1 Tax=Formivibrio citricus TaxID=83765 RepID=A0A1I4ZFW6_9NEIS|nr:thiamine phosphate synthase [Formivibrio citricus]SFN48790.1 thiamine-phosphate diphosphorylase [Formivibrio citricus]